MDILSLLHLLTQEPTEEEMDLLLDRYTVQEDLRSSMKAIAKYMQREKEHEASEKTQ